MALFEKLKNLGQPERLKAEGSVESATDVTTRDSQYGDDLDDDNEVAPPSRTLNSGDERDDPEDVEDPDASNADDDGDEEEIGATGGGEDEWGRDTDVDVDIDSLGADAVNVYDGDGDGEEVTTTPENTAAGSSGDDYLTDDDLDDLGLGPGDREQPPGSPDPDSNQDDGDEDDGETNTTPSDPGGGSDSGDDDTDGDGDDDDGDPRSIINDDGTEEYRYQTFEDYDDNVNDISGWGEDTEPPPGEGEVGPTFYYNDDGEFMRRDGNTGEITRVGDDDDDGDAPKGGGERKPATTEELLTLHREAMNKAQTIGERDRISYKIAALERGDWEPDDDPRNWYTGPARFEAEQQFYDGNLTRAEYADALEAEVEAARQAAVQKATENGNDWHVPLINQLHEGSITQEEYEAAFATEVTKIQERQQAKQAEALEKAGPAWHRELLVQLFDGKIAPDQYQTAFDKRVDSIERGRVEAGGLTAWDLADQGAGGEGDERVKIATTPARFAAEAAFLTGKIDEATYAAAFRRWADQRRAAPTPTSPQQAMAQGATPEELAELTGEEEEETDEWGDLWFPSEGGPSPDVLPAANPPTPTSPQQAMAQGTTGGGVDSKGGQAGPRQEGVTPADLPAPETFLEQRRRLLRDRMATAPGASGLISGATARVGRLTDDAVDFVLARDFDAKLMADGIPATDRHAIDNSDPFGWFGALSAHDNVKKDLTYDVDTPAPVPDAPGDATYETTTHLLPSGVIAKRGGETLANIATFGAYGLVRNWDDMTPLERAGYTGLTVGSLALGGRLAGGRFGLGQVGGRRWEAFKQHLAALERNRQQQQRMSARGQLTDDTDLPVVRDHWTGREAEALRRHQQHLDAVARLRQQQEFANAYPGTPQSPRGGPPSGRKLTPTDELIRSRDAQAARMDAWLRSQRGDGPGVPDTFIRGFDPTPAGRGGLAVAEAPAAISAPAAPAGVPYPFRSAFSRLEGIPSVFRTYGYDLDAAASRRASQQLADSLARARGTQQTAPQTMPTAGYVQRPSGLVVPLTLPGASDPQPQPSEWQSPDEWGIALRVRRKPTPTPSIVAPAEQGTPSEVPAPAPLEAPTPGPTTLPQPFGRPLPTPSDPLAPGQIQPLRPQDAPAVPQPVTRPSPMPDDPMAPGPGLPLLPQDAPAVVEQPAPFQSPATRFAPAVGPNQAQRLHRAIRVDYPWGRPAEDDEALPQPATAVDTSRELEGGPVEEAKEPAPALKTKPEPQPRPLPRPTPVTKTQAARAPEETPPRRPLRPQVRTPGEGDAPDSIEPAARPPGTFPRRIAHREVVEYGYNPATDEFTARVVETSEPVVVEWDRTPPDEDARDVGAYAVAPNRDGVNVEERETEREIKVPLGVRAALKQQARQSGGEPVKQQRKLRVEHDLDSRETFEELVRTRTRQELQRIMAEQRRREQSEAGPGRRGKRRQRQDPLRRSPMDIPDIMILNESPQTRGWM